MEERGTSPGTLVDGRFLLRRQIGGGGAAKALIAEGAVVVDGEIETRIRRKLRPGQVVRFADEEIRIVAADATN